MNQVSLMELNKTNRSSDYGYTSLLIKVPTKEKLKSYAIHEETSYDKLLWKIMQTVDKYPEILKEIQNV